MNIAAPKEQQKLTSRLVITGVTIPVATAWPHKIIRNSAIIRPVVANCLAMHYNRLGLELTLDDLHDYHLDGRNVCNGHVGYSHKQDPTDRRRRCVSSKNQHSNSLPNGRRAPTKFRRNDTPAQRTTFESLHALQIDGRKVQNVWCELLARPATVNNELAGSRQTLLKPPRRLRLNLAHPGKRTHDGPAAEARRNARTTRPRRKLRAQTSGGLLAAHAHESPPSESAQNPRSRAGSA